MKKKLNRRMRVHFAIPAWVRVELRENYPYLLQFYPGNKAAKERPRIELYNKHWEYLGSLTAKDAAKLLRMAEALEDEK